MQYDKSISNKQVKYLDRWVESDNFRAFVYKGSNESKLANSYDEFQLLIQSGIWFDCKENVPKDDKKQTRKVKDAITSAVS